MISKSLKHGELVILAFVKANTNIQRTFIIEARTILYSFQKISKTFKTFIHRPKTANDFICNEQMSLTMETRKCDEMTNQAELVTSHFVRILICIKLFSELPVYSLKFGFDSTPWMLSRKGFVFIDATLDTSVEKLHERNKTCDSQ